MTLVVTAIAGDSIVQVADRRLTNPETREVTNDAARKALFLCTRTSVSFAGISRVGGLPTAEWLQRTMAPHADLSLNVVFEAVATEAERALRRSKHSHYHFVVVAAGWADYQGVVKPFIIRVSNFDTEDPSPAPDVSATFKIAVEFVDQPIAVQFDGAKVVRKEDGYWLARWARRCASHRTSPRPLAHFAGQLMLAYINDDSVDEVGGGMVVQTLTKENSTRARSGVFSPLTTDTSSFVYVSPDGIRLPWFDHLLACSTVSRFSGGSIGAAPPDLQDWLANRPHDDGSCE